MTTHESYQSIQAFKASNTATFRGINYAYVIASYLYETSLVGCIKKLVFSLLFRTTLSCEEKNNKSILLFYSCRKKQRADYDYIPLRLRQILGDHCAYGESSERISLLQVPRTLAQLPSSLIATRGYKTNLFQRLGAALLIAKYRTIEGELTVLLQGKARLVTFSDAQSVENLLTQIARTKKIFTCTNQHGQYRVLDETNMSPDAEAYANFVSDRLLCWGEATRLEFIKAGFSETHMFITGWLREWSIVPESLHAKRQKVFGVMLNGENGKESNIPLIEAANIISKALGLRYLIRLHPLNKASDYQQVINEHCSEIKPIALAEYLAQIDFSIAHMSGATIEMLYVGSPIYLLDDGRLANIFCLPGLSYSNAQEISLAAQADMTAVDFGRSRFVKLVRWYNDDTDQEQRILHALLTKET